MTEKGSTISPDSSQQNTSLGHFTVGFSVGLVAGAVGYYLLGTQEGKKITSHLKTEWSELRKTGAERIGEFEPPFWWVELKKTVRSIVGSSAEKLEKKDIESRPKAPARKSTKPAKKNTFKGI